MTVFLLLFRGVGGATQLPVAPLREALTAAGFERVATYINSGNALVKSDLPRKAVVAEVVELCAAKFGFRKEIHVQTREEWAQVIANNPFPDSAAGKTLHAAVLANEPDAAKVRAVQAFAGAGEGSLSSAARLICTRRTASAPRSSPKNSTEASACRTPRATGTPR